MTDNEIIKALECCAGDDGCDVCPMYKPSSECITELQGKVLDLINRLQANNSSMQSTLAKMSMGVEQAKAEAIKEFWSRLQGIAYRSEVEWSHGEHPMLIELDDAEEIYEEMVGDVE
jgi:hypothetical protein